MVWQYDSGREKRGVEDMNLKLRENALDLALLTGMLLSAVGSFVPVRWTQGLEVLIWATTGGLLVGFLLARSIFRPRVAHAMEQSGQLWR
jgi:hypothetical protein